MEIIRFRSVLEIPALVVDGQVRIARKAASVTEIKTLLLRIKEERHNGNALENSAISKGNKEQ